MEYKYKAIYKDRIVEGIIECEDEQECVLKLKNQGLKVVSIQTLQTESTKSSEEFAEIFISQLKQLLSAGISVDKAVLFIAESVKKNKYKKALLETYKHLREGKSLYQALKVTGLMPKIYLELLRSGEESGNLEEILEYTLSFIQEKKEFKKNLISAILYPSIVFFISILAVSVISVYVIPKFKVLFLSSDVKLPLISKLVFLITDLFNYAVIFLISLLTALLITLQIIKKNLKLRRKIENLILKVPLVKTLIFYVELIKFSQTMYILLKGGLRLENSLSLVENIFSFEVLKEAVKKVKGEVLKGKHLYLAIKDNLNIPELAIEILRIGEETGELQGAFYQIYNTYMGMLKEFISKFLTLLEPLLILGVSLFVGFIVVGLMLAVFSLTSSL